MLRRGMMAGAAGGDPYFANVVMLLNMGGADGSTTFTDLAPSPHTMTAAGNAQIDTSLGYNTGLFDGSADYITTPDDTSLRLNAVDFTIDAWIYPTAGGYYRGIAGKRNANVSVEWQVFLNNGDNKIGFYNGTTIWLSTAQVSLNTLTHIEFALTGSTMYIFINGALDSTHTTVTVPTGSNPVYAGTSTIGLVTTEWYTGHIRALRITKGVCRHTSAFTPPTAPFPTS